MLVRTSFVREEIEEGPDPDCVGSPGCLWFSSWPGPGGPPLLGEEGKATLWSRAQLGVEALSSSKREDCCCCCRRPSSGLLSFGISGSLLRLLVLLLHSSGEGREVIEVSIIVRPVSKILSRSAAEMTSARSLSARGSREGN